MKHWTEIDFQNWLYGVKDQDQHVTACADCRAELERLRVERRRLTAQPQVSAYFLAAQRRSIYNRLEEGRAGHWAAWRWVLSTAMLLAIVVGLTIPRWHKTAPAVSDDQFFRDLSAMEQTAEPKAIQPIHELFEQ
jgi:hypothetical protein